ncbi:hypothetical protein HD601_001048 [Jiangella mangrovi]|uniref:Uncharacterized protein n=1 Tax=Jiangella mangrovi TaxID=1524084 RepID=A0A7W9GML5_9ACTN|nr:hypothetical protein [Jiangella mangrovi]MBB5786473.1 hypothetical protein [Jiangella mangrovi]
MLPPPARAAEMPTPGAVMSGFGSLLSNTGPRLEKSASRSSRSTAPTVSADGASAGLPMQASHSLLPAAMTKSVPCSALMRSTAAVNSGPSKWPGPRPRLMLTMSAPWAAAHSMPAIAHDTEPPPSEPSTLPLSSRAPGATPRRSPSEAAPVPATVDATWVPWPLWSVASGSSVKLAAASTRPARSGWVSSMPVSRTATTVPVPSTPASQAAGAEIWLVLRSSRASVGASSQTFSTAPSGWAASVSASASAPPPAAARPRTAAPNSSVAASTATALTLSSCSRAVAPGTGSVLSGRGASSA